MEWLCLKLECFRASPPKHSKALGSSSTLLQQQHSEAAAAAALGSSSSTRQQQHSAAAAALGGGGGSTWQQQHSAAAALGSSSTRQQLQHSAVFGSQSRQSKVVAQACSSHHFLFVPLDTLLVCLRFWGSSPSCAGSKCTLFTCQMYMPS